MTVLDVLDYTNTSKYTTTRSLEANPMTDSSGWLGLWSGSWKNTAAVTSLTVYIPSGYYTEYSSFALYGIKGE